MIYLVDTGILLRFVNLGDVRSPVIRHAVKLLVEQGQQLVTTHQNFAEFWSVCTRPVRDGDARAGYGWDVEKTKLSLRSLEKRFALLPDAVDTYIEWRRLVLMHAVKGVKVHDTRLVAVMRTHGVRHFLTLNPNDFRRFQDISVVTPEEIIGSSGSS